MSSTSDTCETTRPALLLAGLLVTLHAYFLWMMGAVFWFDSIDYVQLGAEVLTPVDGVRFFCPQHQGSGEGFLWATSVSLLGERAWLGLAVVQHAFACLATFWFLLCVRPILSWPGAFLAGVLITCHPFLRAFDNSIMTESVTASALLVCLGAGAKLLLDRERRSNYTVYLLAAVLGTQFRSYFCALAGLGLAALWLAKEVRLAGWRSLVPLGLRSAALGFGFVFFPLVRWAGTGMLLFPNFNYWAVPVAIENHPNLPGDFYAKIEGELPAEMDRATLEGAAQPKLNIVDWAQIADRMVKNGKSVDEVSGAFRHLAWAIRTESSETIANQASLALVSLGFVRCDLWLPLDHPIRRAYDVAGLHRQNAFYYRWYAWVQAPDYKPWFDAFVQRFRERPGAFAAPAVDQFETSLRPYLRSSSTRKKDPLQLAQVPFDVWPSLAVLGIVVFLRKHRALGALLAMPIVVNYLVMLYTGLGGIRYFHMLLPIYLFFSVYLCVAACAFAKERLAVLWRLPNIAGEMTFPASSR